MDDVTFGFTPVERFDELTSADREFLQWIARFAENLRLLPAEDAGFFAEPVLEEIARFRARLIADGRNEERSRLLIYELDRFVRGVERLAPPPPRPPVRTTLRPEE